MRNDGEIYNATGTMSANLAPVDACKAIMPATLSDELDSCSDEYYNRLTPSQRVKRQPTFGADSTLSDGISLF
jgi:hypothetical protein